MYDRDARRRERYAQDAQYREREKARSREIGDTPTKRARDKARVARNRAYVQSLKVRCADCGVEPGDPRRLHFHHVDPSTKVASVAHLCYASRQRLDAEIEKCVVVCISCHNARHKAVAA
jgi:hypothetical protein